MSFEPVAPEARERAMRVSYTQAMLSAVYGASTGGMFLTGYALRLGANNLDIGLMSTIPMLCVVVQLVSSTLVERGVSRRTLTIAASVLNVAGWLLIVALPYGAALIGPGSRVLALIGILAIVSVFAQIAGNARSSWLGDLVPAHRRGVFFGRSTMYAGIVGVIFAIGEGAFLDRVKQGGVNAFTWLFLFGMAFGAAACVLFLPQADVPLEKREAGRMMDGVRATFANRPLMSVMLFAITWSLQSIVGLFPAAYLLRDLKVPFLGVGIANAVGTLAVMATSPFWGRIVDRYGCRPVLIVCSLILMPLPMIWVFVTSPFAVYAIVTPVNVIAGFAWAGVTIALSTLLFKMTDGPARTVQLAVYSIVVTLIAAPMPAIGGRLPDWLTAAGFPSDLRCTFYAGIPIVMAACMVARRIREDGAHPAGELLRDLPSLLLGRTRARRSE